MRKLAERVERSFPLFLLRCSVVFFMALSLSCGEKGIGDPCLPEQVPEGGFDGNERYIESSSVQCRSRICLVYELEGDPRTPLGSPECGSNASCPTPDEVADRVFCSCRCKAPPGVNARTCSCPDGFTCVEDVLQDTGGDGIRGGYCVPKRLVGNEGT